MAKNFETYLANAARGYAGFITTKAKGYSESARVRKTIKTTVKKEGTGRYTLFLSAKGTPETPGLASYREYGTNPHPIKGNPVLVFPWDKAADTIPRTPDGKVILRSVNHPGSKADNNDKGYLRPAGKDTVNFIKDEFRGKVAASIRAEIVGAFKK